MPHGGAWSVLSPEPFPSVAYRDQCSVPDRQELQGVRARWAPTALCPTWTGYLHPMHMTCLFPHVCHAVQSTMPPPPPPAPGAKPPAGPAAGGAGGKPSPGVPQPAPRPPSALVAVLKLGPPVASYRALLGRARAVSGTWPPAHITTCVRRKSQLDVYLV
jgi:hypothetical protein